MAAEETADDTHALTPVPQGTVMTLGPFWLGEMSVTPRAEFTYEEWQAALYAVQRIAGSVQFWLGDLLEMGEAKWGEKYAQALDATDYEEKSLRNAAWVARQIPPDRRRMSKQVSFSHHEVVAPLDPDQQEYWLQRVEAESLTRDQLRIAIRQQQAAAKGFVGEFWLMVKCKGEQDQVDLAERLRQEGRVVNPR